MGEPAAGRRRRAPGRARRASQQGEHADGECPPDRTVAPDRAQRELDVVANNIANLNTTGFKADGSVFEEYLMPVARADGFQGGDQRLSFVQRPRAPGTTSSHGPGRADRQSARRRDRRQRLPGGADAARRALHAQRRAADQRHRRARHHRRRPACSATAARSPSSPTTTTSRSAPTARSRCAKAPIPTSDSARGKLRLVAFDQPQQLQKDGVEPLRRAERRHAAAGDQQRARHAGRDREIERARRRRDDAHDRDHAHLHAGRQHAAAAERHAPQRRSTSSPKSRPEPDGDISHARAPHRSDRNDGPGTQRPGHLQQHRQHAHHRLQAPARRIPGSALRARQPRRHADLDAGQHPAGRHRPRLAASRPSARRG